MSISDDLRRDSGNYKSADPLVAFLYLLMRDATPPGVIAGIVESIGASNFEFTNGHLARYAQFIASRIGNGPRLKDSGERDDSTR